MYIFAINKDVYHIYQRALALSISKEFVHHFNGQSAFNYRQDSEQENRRRELLAVEEEAQKEKIIAQHGEAHFRHQVSSQLEAKIMTQVNIELDNKERLLRKTLQVEQAAPDILDLLAVKAASIKRITPLAKNLTWLATDLIKLVNKPQYRKRADVPVHDASLAVSYIGLENLKLVMPTFIVKHWLPISTSPYPLMKRKLWSDSLSIALASRILAKAHNLDEYSAFALGMLSNVGMLAITRSFLAQFNEIHGAELRQAYENKDKRLHDILLAIKPPAHLLLTQLAERGYQIGAQLVEQMHFERLAIVEPMFDLAYVNDFKKMHPLSHIVIKARAFVDVRNLTNEDLISADDAQHFLSNSHLSADDITLLKKSDIDHLTLKFK